MCIANAPSTSMLKIFSDLIINYTIGSSAKINKSLQFCFRISCFFMILPANQYKVPPNLKFLADPPQKIWEQHFKLHFHISIVKMHNYIVTQSIVIKKNIFMLIFRVELVFQVNKDAQDIEVNQVNR